MQETRYGPAGMLRIILVTCGCMNAAFGYLKAVGSSWPSPGWLVLLDCCCYVHCYAGRARSECRCIVCTARDVYAASAKQSIPHCILEQPIECLVICLCAHAAGLTWRMVGMLTFLDPPRPDTKRTIERALEFGADVKMITGRCGI